jgi:peptide/nickel transport system substrate-binding protein
VDRIRESGNFQFHELLLQGMNPFVAVNLTVPPFGDILVRKALNLAVDREALIRVVAQGEGEVQYGPMSSSMMSYWPGVEEIGYGYDLEQAKALMAEAGWEDSDGDGVLDKDGQSLSFPFNANANSEVSVRVAQVLQEQYKALGMALEIEQMESGNLIANFFSGNFEIMVMGYTWTGDVDVMYLLFHSSQIGALNGCQVDDPELDEMIEKTRTTMDPEERQDWADAVQRRIVEQAYCVPLYTPITYTPISNRVKGWYTSPVYGWLYLDGIYIEE